MTAEIYLLLHDLLYTNNPYHAYQEVTLEILSGIITIVVLCLPFYIVWRIVKRWL